MKKIDKIVKSQIYKFLNENLNNELDVFHGSTTSFDKFNHKKYLGKGAGSQAFGWGSYFTDDESVANGYADMNKPKSLYQQQTCYVNGQELTDEEFYSYICKSVTELYNKIHNQDIFKDFEHYYSNYTYMVGTQWPSFMCNDLIKKSFASISVTNHRKIETDKYMIQKCQNDDTIRKSDLPYYINDLAYTITFQALIEQFVDEKNVEFKTGVNPYHGYMYNAQIPDDNGINYLSWYDKPTPQQMIMLLNGMFELKPTLFKNLVLDSDFIFGQIGDQLIYWKKIHDRTPNLFKGIVKRIAHHLLDNTNTSFQDYYYQLRNIFKSQKATSLFFQHCGFDGIKFPSGTRTHNRNKSRDDSMNYVVFDQNKTQIINKTQKY